MAYSYNYTKEELEKTLQKIKDESFPPREEFKGTNLIIYDSLKVQQDVITKLIQDCLTYNQECEDRFNAMATLLHPND
jgi:hypothetical protein